MEKFEAIAVSLMGIRSVDFYVFRVGTFFRMLDEFYTHHKKQYQQQANLTRMLAATLVNIQVKDEDKLKPEQLWKFDWDEPEAEPTAGMTDEQIAEHNRRLMAMLD